MYSLNELPMNKYSLAVNTSLSGLCYVIKSTHSPGTAFEEKRGWETAYIPGVKVVKGFPRWWGQYPECWLSFLWPSCSIELSGQAKTRPRNDARKAPDPSMKIQHRSWNHGWTATTPERWVCRASSNTRMTGCHARNKSILLPYISVHDLPAAADPPDHSTLCRGAPHLQPLRSQTFL